MKKKVLLTAFLCCVANLMFAQLTLKGKVVDEDGYALVGASVWLEYTTRGTSTDANGQFVLQNVPDGEYVLRASSLDYNGDRLPVVSSQEDIVFTLRKSPFKLHEVVVTGTGTHRRLKNSPVQIDVLSKRELENVNIPSFENAMMALSPSLSFTPTAMGTYMQMNGLSNKYILVLVDGKKLAGDVARNTDLSRINMNNVKRIEILKGSASSLYGSEAMGGVINIITDKHKEMIYASSNTRYAEHGQFTQSVNTDVNYGKISSSTSFQRNQANGWQLHSQERVTSKTGEISYKDTDKQAVSRFYTDIYSQKLSYDPNKSLSLYVQGSLFDKKIIRPAGSYKYDMLYDDYSISGGVKYLLKNKGVVNLDIHTDNFEYTKLYTIKDKTFEVGDKEKSRRQKYYDVNLKSILDFGKLNRVTIGTQYQLDYLESASDVKDIHSDISSRDVYTWSLYAQDEIKLLDNKLQLVPGIRYVYHEAFKSRLTPKLSAMYSLDHFNFRASYSSGFRSPDMKELYIRTVSGSTLSLGNSDLKPESSNYYSLNAEYMNDFMTFSVTGFTNRIKNMIDTKDISETLTAEEKTEGLTKKQLYTNLSKARVTGIEVNLNTSLGRGMSLGLGYSYVNPKDNDTQKPLQRISKHTGNVNANWEKKWWIINSNFNLSGRLQSRRYFEKNGDAPNFNLWNLSTRHRIRSYKGLVFEPGIGVENIFDFVDDRPFGVNYSTLSPGRTFYASLSIKFSK